MTGETPTVQNQAPATNEAPPQSGVSDSQVQKDPGKPATFLDDNSEGLKGAADWPQDWREKAAGDDEKFLNTLKRYNSPLDAFKAQRELQKKIGEVKKPLGENPTAEELAQYRKDNGIPETHDKYDLTFENGMVIGEEDKTYVDQFLQDMHKSNAPPGLVKGAIQSYLQMRDAAVAQQAEIDAKSSKEMVEYLKKNLGPEYKGKMEATKAFLGNLPDNLNEKFFTMRYSDGTPVLNDPAFYNNVIAPLMAASGMDATIAGNVGGTGVSINERIEQIQKIIRDEPHRYYNGEEGKKLQAEMAQLSDIQQKSRDKAA